MPPAHGAVGNDRGRHHVKPGRYAVEAEQQDAEECRLEEECGEHLVALLDQELPHGVADRLFVVHDQDGHGTVGQRHTDSVSAQRHAVKFSTPALGGRLLSGERGEG